MINWWSFYYYGIQKHQPRTEMGLYLFSYICSPEDKFQKCFLPAISHVQNRVLQEQTILSSHFCPEFWIMIQSLSLVAVYEGSYC